MIDPIQIERELFDKAFPPDTLSALQDKLGKQVDIAGLVWRAWLLSKSWLPIEQAPRDGNAFIVCCEDGPPPEWRGDNTVVAEWWNDDDYSEGGRWVCAVGYPTEPDCPFKPTHFLPIPLSVSTVRMLLEPRKAA